MNPQTNFARDWALQALQVASEWADDSWLQFLETADLDDLNLDFNLVMDEAHRRLTGRGVTLSSDVESGLASETMLKDECDTWNQALATIKAMTATWRQV